MVPLILNNMKYVSQAYKMGRRVLEMSQLLVGVLTSIICFIVIELAVDIKSDLLTILVLLLLLQVIFVISLLLSSIGFDAYDRAFQTLLLTIILNESVAEDPISRVGSSHFTHIDKQSIESDSRLQIYMKAESWMKEEKAKKKKNR